MRFVPKLILALTLGGALALGACKKAPEEAAPVNNVVEEVPLNEVANVAEPAPAENVTNVVEPKPAPAPDVSEEQQTIDDADATGLTTRLDRSEEAQNAAN